MSKTTVADLLDVLKENETLRRFYAKPGCKKCLGRGHRELQSTTMVAKGNTAFYKQLCKCVIENAKKEIDNIAIVGK